LYELSLRAGDVLHVKEVPGSGDSGGISFSLYGLPAFPGGGGSLGVGLCPSEETAMDVSSQTVNCTIPRTGTYLVVFDLYDAYDGGNTIQFSVTHARRSTGSVTGSCQIAGAPFIPVGTTQLAAGYLCPSGGTQYFRLKVTHANETLVATWTTDKEAGINWFFVYRPSVTVFTIDRAQSVCQERLSLQGAVEICSASKPGNYVVAIRGPAMQFSFRLKASR
jgi:hypothetical protein